MTQTIVDTPDATPEYAKVASIMHAMAGLPAESIRANLQNGLPLSVAMMMLRESN